MRAGPLARAALLLAAVVSQAAPAAATAPRHELEIELHPATGEVEIRDRVRLAGHERFGYLLAPWLELESLRLDDRDVEAEPDGDGFSLRLPDAGNHQIDLRLRGRPPSRGDGGGAALASSAGDDGFYLPGYDNWIPHDWRQPLEYELRVSLPDTWRAVVSGRLLEETNRDGRYRAGFASQRPGEAPSLFAGPYRVDEKFSGGTRLRTYFHAGLEPLSGAYLEAAENYIQRYQDLIGAYPYHDFHIVSAPLPVGLGFPNLTYISRRIVPLPFMRTRSLAHEVLHNWWGNGVLVDYAGGNWAEGLTTYLADYALERDKGDAAARGMRVKWLRDYAALPAARDQALREFKSKQHQAAQVIGYNKVAFVFHMLTQEIGEPAFIQGLRRIWQQHRFRSAGWDDLRAAFEHSSGRDLGWFFAQWVERRGAPRLSLGAHGVSKTEQGYRTRIEILQPVSGYRLRLPVLLATEDGFERYQVAIEENLTRLEWITSGKPRYLHFDPDSDVFRKLQPDETPPILRDVTLAADTRVVIDAVDPAFVEAARDLASRLLDGEPRFAARADNDSPLLLVVASARLAAQLEALGLRLPPELGQAERAAMAWSARLDNRRPALIVSAEAAAQLRPLARSLPHYGGQSYVLFEDGRATERGIWPIREGALMRMLDDDASG